MVSSPCFELWLLLHAQAQTAHIDCHAAQRLSAELGLSRGKTIPQDVRNKLIDTFEIAKQRAIDLRKRHEDNGAAPRTNPSTDVWRLVDCIRNTK